MKQTLWAVVGLVMTVSAAAAQPRSVYMEDLTWYEIRDAIAAGKTTAIVFAGGLEQNGPHMALVKHNAIARYVAEQAAERLGNALVYPVIPFTLAGDPVAKTGHARFVGTVSLSSEVFLGVVRQVALAAASGGFKNVFLMGDHGGGQDELKLAAEGLDADWKAKGVRVRYISFAKSAQQTNKYMTDLKLANGHAGVPDTAQVMFLDKGSQWIRQDKIGSNKGQPEPSTGMSVDPTGSTAEIGKAILDFKIADAVDQIRAALAAPAPAK